MPTALVFRGGANGGAQKNGLSSTLVHNVGDLKLRATASDVIFSGGAATVSGHCFLSVEKPGSFIFDFDVPKKDFRFQFMNTVNVLNKRLNLTYTHVRGENKTILDGMLVLDPSHKLSANYALGSRNCKLKYSYIHKGVTIFEPCYDLASNSWDFVASWRVLEGDLLEASYCTARKSLKLERTSWTPLSNRGGKVKLCATFNLAEGLRTPTIGAESSWTFEM